MVCCPQGQELQPEKKKQNRCNHCGCTGTALRSRDRLVIKGSVPEEVACGQSVDKEWNSRGGGNIS